MISQKDIVFAREQFIVDVQIALHSAIEKKGWTRADLATAMGVERSVVEYIFCDNPDILLLETLALAAFALGLEARLILCEKCNVTPLDS